LKFRRDFKDTGAPEPEILTVPIGILDVRDFCAILQHRSALQSDQLLDVRVCVVPKLDGIRKIELASPCHGAFENRTGTPSSLTYPISLGYRTNQQRRFVLITRVD
jgi:hypothetical protein